RTVMIETSAASPRILETIFREMKEQAHATLLNEGFPDRKQKHERSLAVRYRGQSFELQIKQTSGNIAAAFHRAHQARYGHAQTENAVEIVSARLRSSGIVDKTRLPRLRRSVSKKIVKPHAFVATFFERQKIRAAVYRR